MRWTVRILTTVLAASLARPAAAQHPITLQEAIQRAFTVQPAMVQARGDQSDAGMQRLAAVGAFIPTITVNSSAFRQNTASIVNGLPAQAGSYQYSSGLTLSLDLFDGLRRIQRYRNAAATISAADAGYTNQQYQVTLQTKQAFYNALANEELVRVAESQLDRARQQLRISIDKLHAGSAPRSDSLRFTLSWTILNGFAREQQQTAATVQREVANARAEDARRQVNAALTQQLAAAATAYVQIDIARANLAAATEDLRVQNERYRVGAATILDLLTSQASLTQAEVNLVQTRYNYLIARAQVEAVVGRML